MGAHERHFVDEVFKSNWIAPLGPMVDGFERDLQQYTGTHHAAALSSGTAALHLALILLDVRPGDYVICQSLTFSASANPIRYLGATPVFVDSDEVTWNMCPNALEKAIQACINGKPDSRGIPVKAQKPKAIIPVHLYGMPADMDAISHVADKYDVPLVEDAAEALGSHINGKMCGSFGYLNALSFNGNKIITTSGGGALLANDEVLIHQARFLATQARDPAPHYQHSQIGYNYRLSNVLAAIGRGQMMVLEERVRQRRENYAFYYELLNNHPGITFQIEPEGFFSNRWLTAIQIEPELANYVDCERLRLALENENIEARPIWKPMHLQPVFENAPYFGGGIAEKLFSKGLCLPSGSNLNRPERDRINNALQKVLTL